jgi:hypothetical protein
MLKIYTVPVVKTSNLNRLNNAYFFAAAVSIFAAAVSIFAAAVSIFAAAVSIFAAAVSKVTAGESVFAASASPELLQAVNTATTAIAKNTFFIFVCLIFKNYNFIFIPAFKKGNPLVLSFFFVVLGYN